MNNPIDSVPVGTFVYVSIKGYVEGHGIVYDKSKYQDNKEYYGIYVFEKETNFGAWRGEFNPI